MDVISFSEEQELIKKSVLYSTLGIRARFCCSAAGGGEAAVGGGGAEYVSDKVVSSRCCGRMVAKLHV